MDSGDGAEVRISARQIYEQSRSALPQTKSGEYADLARPLPVDFAPRWDETLERTAGGITTVDVPISAATGYTAVFPCTEHGDTNHDHSTITVTQKLAIVMSEDSTACYVVNIIPFDGCALTDAALASGFRSDIGMDGLSGFAAYHHLDGSLSRIDGFDRGIKTGSAYPSNNEAIGAITRNAQLYATTPGITSASIWDYDMCEICLTRCEFAYNSSVQYATDPTLYRYFQECRAKHCLLCRKLTKNCTCTKPTDPPHVIDPKLVCPTCGVHRCKKDHSSPPPICAYCGIACSSSVDPRQTPEIVHGEFLRAQFGSGRIPYIDLHNFQQGCYYVDKYRVGSGDEYLHNMRLPTENYDVAYNKLRNYFISVVKEAKSSTPTYISRIGEAMHPVLDLYISNDKRMGMLNYYSYPTYGNIIPRGALSNQSRDIQTMFDAIKTLPQYPSDAQVAAIFDAWAMMGF